MNRDCPSPWWDVFPEGVPNVEFVEFEEVHTSSGIQGKMAYDYFGEVDYHSILSRMRHTPHCASVVAVHGRFHRIPDTDLSNMVEAIPVGTDRVFLLCDNHRESLKGRLKEKGIEVINARSREMSDDFDRKPSDTADFIADWRSLCTASTVVTNCEESSALHPLRQKKATIIPVR